MMPLLFSCVFTSSFDSGTLQQRGMFPPWTGLWVLVLDALLALNFWSYMTVPWPVGSYWLDTIDPIFIHLPGGSTAASDSPFTPSPTTTSHQLLIWRMPQKWSDFPHNALTQTPPCSPLNQGLKGCVCVQFFEAYFIGLILLFKLRLLVKGTVNVLSLSIL